MNAAQIAEVASNGSVAVAVVVFLWKGLLPELRKQTSELRAIEKHLARAGERGVTVEGVIRDGFESLDNRFRDLARDTAFLVAAEQRAHDRSTRPTEAPEGT